MIRERDHGVERGSELGVAIPDEEPEAAANVTEVHEQVAGLLGDPGAGGVSGDPGDVAIRRRPCSMTTST